MSKTNMAKAVFFDRDGTLLKERGYLSRADRFRFYKQIMPALRSLQRKGLKIIIITNQSGVGRGYFSLVQLGRIHAALKKKFGSHGVRISGIYYCPHKPDHGCSCRKPRLGMVKAAARDLRINLQESYVVGDQARDIELATKMGGKGILVLTGAGLSSRTKARRFHPVVVKSAASASKWILNDLKDVIASEAKQTRR